uniref:Uncharacterized protein n=1 Tax=Mola mola TaxID=94237 RepID=A0A3Q4C103_MOLML
MGADKRLSRGERSGRYGSDGRRDDPEWHDRRQGTDMERDYVHALGDDKHRECRDSPERGRIRHKSDRSDDEYDGDYPDQHYKMEQEEEESETIMLRGLPPNVTEDDVSVHDAFTGQRHKELRKMTGTSWQQSVPKH